VARDFSLLQNVETDSGAHPASYSKGTKFLPQGQSGHGVNSTTHSCPVLSLGISGSVQLLPLLASMQWTEKTVVFIGLKFYI